MTDPTLHPFAQLLAMLGRAPDDLITVNYERPGSTFSGRVVRVADAVAAVKPHPVETNLWYSVQPFREGGAAKGKASAADVTSLIALYADLDVKPSALPNDAACWAVVAELAEFVGEPPTCIVSTGHGLHPYWRVDPIEPIAGTEILRRWGALVAEVCSRHGDASSAGKRDGVYNLDRVLRIPGTINIGKPGKGMRNVPTSLIPGRGKPMRREYVEAILDAWQPVVAPRGLSDRRARTPDDRDDEERVFSEVEAARYVETMALEPLRATPEGSGFNEALNKATFTIAAFVPEFYSEAAAIDMLTDAISAQFPAGPDSADWATIRSGFGGSKWSARRPSAEERADPFDRYYDGPVSAAPSRARPRSSGDVGTSVLDGEHVEPPDPSVFLPEEFWQSRRIFAHLRQSAHAAMESPEGVLFAALGLTLARTMPNVRLSAPVGVEASLNLMVVLTGDPGDGKSVCRKIAESVLDFGPTKLHKFCPSSGQGLSGQYQYLVKEKGQPPRMEPTRFNAMAVVEESDTIAALASNPTSTLSSELRKAAMGEDIGFANIGDTQTGLPEHSYRFVLLMCLQPELGAWLLGDAAGGLPQRFLWACVRDPHVIRDAARPGVWKVALPFEAGADPMSGAPRSNLVIPGSERIWSETREAKIARKELGRAVSSDLDGHSMLTRRKVSAVLAIMDGRLDDTDQDWALAGMIMRVSEASRAWVQASVAAVNARRAEAAGKHRGRTESAARKALAAETSREVGDLAAQILAFVEAAGADGVTWGKILNRFHRDEKSLVERAIAELEVVGKVAVTEDGSCRGKPVRRVTRA